MKHSSGQQLFVQQFPLNAPPGKVIKLTLDGVQSSLLDTSGSMIKPFKKPKQQREPRSITVEIEFEEAIVAQEVKVDFSTGEIFVVGKVNSAIFLYPQILMPSRSTITTAYDKKKGKKLINFYFQGPGHAFFGIDRIFKFYDRVYCIDTNTRVSAAGVTIAVTTAITVTSENIGDKGIHITSDHTIQLISNDPPSGNPELHGIWMLLARVWQNHPHLLEGRLAIITDTELGKIRGWNERVEPFYDGNMLPRGVDIFYASADVGSEEYLPNRLMKACDSLSTKKLEEIS